MEQHQVCAQCTHNCALLHGKGKTSSFPPSSFFKIMLGDDFSTVLHLPPKFSRTASDLVDKKIVLSDSSGHQWNAKISNVDGSLALEEGWNKFSLDHRLEVGDFVVFFYDNESHFYVQIYDRSGCERREFSKKRNKNKRSRDRSGSPDRNATLVGQGPNASVVSKPDAQKMDSQKGEADVGRAQNNMENISKHDKSNGSAQSLCREEYREDPHHMTSQDDCAVNGTGKIRTGDSKVSHVDYGSCVHRNDATECICLKLKETLDSGGATSKAPEVEFSGKKKTPIDTDRSAYNKTSTLKLEENRKNNFVKSNGEVQECQFDKGLESDQVVKSKRKNDLDIDGLNTKQRCNGIPNISDDSHNGEMSKGIKQEVVSAGMTRNGASFKGRFSAEGEKMSKRIKKEPHVDMTPNVPSSNYEFGATGSSKVIKKELIQDPDMIDQDDNDDDDDDHGHDIQTSASVSCMVPADNDHFLELPTRLPYSRRLRAKMERMLVFLRNPMDPRRNLWPVLYHEHSRFKILTTGWSQFRRANNIQPADMCTFELEAESERIFNVDIVHN